MTRTLWLGASALAFAYSNIAQAQTAPTAATPTPAADSDDASSQDQEIIVTAQRRSENLMKTPVAASVLSGTDLANKGVVQVDQLQFNMPSVTVDNFGQGLEFNVRGIGKAEHNSQTTTGVITYRDGVATSPGYVQEEPYFDIASVQVLRGPQGTIAGENATGGAVFVTTNDPSLTGGTHGYVLGQYGNYNDAGAQGAINLPLSDTLAARVAFYGERRDGFYHITGPGGAPYHGNNNDLRTAAGRLSLLWKPTDRLSVLLKTDYDYLGQGAYPADPFLDRFKVLPGTTTPNPGYTDLFDITANTPQEAKDRFLRTILKIDYELGGGVKFRSITGYQAFNTKYRADLDGTASGTNPYYLPTFGANEIFYDDNDEHIFSQELNLISPDNTRFTWLIGGYFQANKYFFKPPFQFLIDAPAGTGATGNPVNQYSLQGTNPQRTFAAFGQLGYQLTPKLKIEVGGRYTDSRTTNHVDVDQYTTPIRDDQTADYRNFSYKVSVGWEVNRDNYLYGFAATGYHEGGLNVPVGLGQPAPFDSERVMSYEAGWKANFLGSHVRTTIDAFYNDYKNFQVTIGYPAYPTFGFEVNVPGTTKIYGLEADGEATFGNFSMDAGLGLLHSEVGQFFAVDPRTVPTGAFPAACDPATGPANPGTPYAFQPGVPIGACYNLKGQEQTYAPKLTFNVGAQYVFHLGGDDKVTPRVNFGHVGRQFATLFETEALGDRLDKRDILGAQLEWAHKTWVVTAYGTNLTNQHYVAALNSDLDFAGPPRQYGVRVTKTF